MLEIKGQTILERQIHALNQCGVKDIVVVRGYQKEQFHVPNVRYYDNDRYHETGELVSLFLAEAEMSGRFLFLYSDIIFDPAIVEKLLKSQANISIVVDRAWADNPHSLEEVQRKKPDLVITHHPPQPGYRFLPTAEGTTLSRIGRVLPPSEADGEFIGLAMFSEEGTRLLRTVYHQSHRCFDGRKFHEADSLEMAAFTDILQEIVDCGSTIACVDIYKGWLEIDTFEDYRRAWAKVK
jgi:phosphoenolpyruvate phosphomutase